MPVVPKRLVTLGPAPSKLGLELGDLQPGRWRKVEAGERRGTLPRGNRHCMDDQLDLLRLVVGRLDRLGIPYMLSGSLALAYYAEPRMTRDIDLIVELAPAAVPGLVEAFQDDFYCDAEAVSRAVETRRMVNLIHQASTQKVDLVIRKDTPYRREEFARRREVAVDSFRVWIVSPEDLVLSKLVWAKDSASELQRRDVTILIASRTDLDWLYLDRWARDLDIHADLEACRR